MKKYKCTPWVYEPFDIWESAFGSNSIITVPRGTYLFYQGDRLDSVYIVKSGRILLTALSNTGIERILMFALQGCIIGEDSVDRTTAVTFAARTVVECKLIKIAPAIFTRKLMDCPELALQALEVQSSKQRALMFSITNLFFDDAYLRTVRELLCCAYVYGEKTPEGVLIKIPINQEQLGKRIQASRITVGKIYKRLAAEKLVGRKSPYYII